MLMLTWCIPGRGVDELDEPEQGIIWDSTPPVVKATQKGKPIQIDKDLTLTIPVFVDDTSYLRLCLGFGSGSAG